MFANFGNNHFCARSRLPIHPIEDANCCCALHSSFFSVSFFFSKWLKASTKFLENREQEWRMYRYTQSIEWSTSLSYIHVHVLPEWVAINKAIIYRARFDFIALIRKLWIMELVKICKRAAAAKSIDTNGLIVTHCSACNAILLGYNSVFVLPVE